MVTWVLQKFSNLERSQINENIKAALENTDHTVHEIQLIPFTDQIIGGDPEIEGPVVAYGGIPTIDRVVARTGWKPGLWRSKGFREEVVRDKLGDLYGNSDLKVISVHKVSEFARENGMEFFFVKPNTDSKEFPGTVSDATRFSGWAENMMSVEWVSSEFDVCISSVKEWGMEWRLPVVDGKVADYSVYRQWQRVMPERIINNKVLEVAEKAISLHNPAPAYTLDIGQLGGEYKVIEYNGFNSAGMYACDMKNVVSAVNTYVESTL